MLLSFVSTVPNAVYSNVVTPPKPAKDGMGKNKRNSHGNNDNDNNSERPLVQYKPSIFVDEIGLTSDKYIPLNNSVGNRVDDSADAGTAATGPTTSTSSIAVTPLATHSTTTTNNTTATTTTAGLLPLRISFGPLSVQRWLLMANLEESLQAQSELGFTEKDLDDVRR